MASVNCGTSSILRDVMMLASSTTGRSIYNPPAFLMSTAIEGQQVSFRSRTTLAEMST